MNPSLLSFKIWHTEPTNVGLLALAAKTADAYPIEEYSTEKGRGAKKRWKGRADLRILDDNGNTFNFETKQLWMWIHNKPSKVAEMVNNKLNDAVDDVNELTDKPDFSVALVFVVPFSLN